MAADPELERSEFPDSRFELVAEGRESWAFALAVTGLALLAFCARVWAGRTMPTPWIMTDELLYGELAKSFADGGDLLLREQPWPVVSLAYPPLVSPAWLAGSLGMTFAVAKVINAALMTSAAVPVYLWTKRLAPPAYAALTAGLVLLLPALVLTGTLMTENAFFPAFLLAAFAIGRALERPTVRAQAFALAAVGLAIAARFQGVVLLAILPSALALKIVFDLRAPGGGLRAAGAELRRWLPTAAALIALGAAYVGYKTLQGVPLRSGLGAHAGVTAADYRLEEAARWLIRHFAELGLAVAVVPASALVVLVGLALYRGTESAAERSFLAVAVASFVWVVAEAAVYASSYSFRVEERYMFAVAPLLFMALAVWLSRGLPRPMLLTVFAAAAPAVLLLALPLPSLLNISILSDTFTLIPLLRLSQTLDGGADTVRLLMLAGGAVAALSFALLPRRLAGLLPLGVAAFLALASYSTFGAIRDQSRATFGLAGGGDASWVDHRIGDEEAAFLYAPGADLFRAATIMWHTEFWNRSVGPIYHFGAQEPSSFPATPVSLDRADGRLLTATGEPTSGTSYAVAGPTESIAGTVVARRGDLSLYRVAEPLRLASLVEGVYGDGWMAQDAALTQYAAPRSGGGSVVVEVSRRAWGGPDVPGRVRIEVGPLSAAGGVPAIARVTAERTATIQSRGFRRLTLAAPRPPFRLAVHVEPTFSPADFGLADTRELGAQVNIAYLP